MLGIAGLLAVGVVLAGIQPTVNEEKTPVVLTRFAPGSTTGPPVLE